MHFLEELNISSWEQPISDPLQHQAIKNLENGKVLYMPMLTFTLEQEERRFLIPDYVDPKRKNISFDLKKDLLGGSLCQNEELDRLKHMLKRYALMSSNFIKKLFPHYAEKLIIAKTSFRPVEISGRKSSIRKDDTRLHVDAFPSSPTQGQRILRIFTNINPEGKPRVWKVGEPFEEVVNKFAPKVPKFSPVLASLLKLFKITKGKRSGYDHYMLHIHNSMKEDTTYQHTAHQEEIRLQSQSSWITFTDQVSHAALSGQHVLEQTFFLPTSGLQRLSSAPLSVLETYLKQQLVS